MSLLTVMLLMNFMRNVDLAFEMPRLHPEYDVVRLLIVLRAFSTTYPGFLTTDHSDSPPRAQSG